MSLTLTRHILESQSGHPEARGRLSGLLTQIGVAAKVISAQVNRAGLLNILGAAGTTNIQGEAVQKLDVFAQRTFVDFLARSGYVAGMCSEEEEEWIEVPEANRGEYVMVFDPLDGSTNIDANVSVGTIFAIFPRATKEANVTRRDFLRPGREAVAAGYVVYGSSTVFVYSVAQGVHGFTLDPTIGEFVLSHPDLRIPKECKVLSINDCNEPYWFRWTTEAVAELKHRNDQDKRRISGRFIGSAVADFHRNLLYGGVFLYPPDRRNTKGRLRLLYECTPLAWLIEHAGGYASSGEQAILDILPHSLHQRVGFVAGNRKEVELAESMVRTYGYRDERVGQEASDRPVAEA